MPVTERAAAGSKLNVMSMNSRPRVGGRFWAIVAWSAFLESPVSYSITGMAECVGTVIGPQLRSSGATLGSSRIALRYWCWRFTNSVWPWSLRRSRIHAGVRQATTRSEAMARAIATRRARRSVTRVQPNSATATPTLKRIDGITT